MDQSVRVCRVRARTCEGWTPWIQVRPLPLFVTPLRVTPLFVLTTLGTPAFWTFVPLMYCTRDICAPRVLYNTP
eukprot:9478727-Pyramimonas_sp.AAC.1